jgi:hypothetical protein
MENNFDIPSKGVEKIPAKTAKELAEEITQKEKDVLIPVKPDAPKLSIKDSIQILKKFLLDEAVNITSGNFGGWQLWVKIIIVLAIILIILFT